jgi:anti-sigma regulatory factor (Ser/Thr protein kinase)
MITSTAGLAREVSASSVILLPHAPSSVSVARHRLGADLRAHGVPEASVGDAILVLSELLTNAIRHAKPLPGGQVEVSWSIQAGTLKLAISDGGGPTHPHQVRPLAPAQNRAGPQPVREALSVRQALGGRGLSIVGHLASRWGVRGDDQGTTVWAVLPAAANGSLKRRPRRSPARTQARPSAG